MVTGRQTQTAQKCPIPNASHRTRYRNSLQRETTAESKTTNVLHGFWNINNPQRKTTEESKYPISLTESGMTTDCKKQHDLNESFSIPRTRFPRNIVGNNISPQKLLSVQKNAPSYQYGAASHFCFYLSVSDFYRLSPFCSFVIDEPLFF